MPARFFAAVLFPLLCVAAASGQGPQWIGAGGCASSNCHGRARALGEKESRILGNEYAIWSVKDKHSKAYSVLSNERSRRMAEILRLGNPQAARLCLSCHAVGSPQNSISDGVACEACHGPAEKWLGPHTRANSHAESLRLGLVDTANLAARTRACLGCHLGARDKTVGHDLIAAGHPDLVFELDTFSAGQPLHWREPKPEAGNRLPRVRGWAVGQAVMLAERMRQLAARAGTGWPEFAEMECYQCHHDLRADSWRTERGFGGRKPGSLRLNVPQAEVIRALVGAAARDQSGELEKRLARLEELVAGRLADGAAIAQAAQSAAELADALAARFSRHDFDAAGARAIVHGLIAAAGRIADSGVGAAEQATMAVDSLGAACAQNPASFQAAVAQLYDYLEHPSAYRPAEFAAQLRRVAGLLN